MSDLYEVSLYDTEGVKQGILQGWEYLDFTQKLNGPWYHNLRYEVSSKDVPGEEYIALLRNTVDVDWILRVVRTDSVTGAKALVYEGFNRTIVDQSKKEGSIIFNLYGSGYTELLSRRVVIPPVGTENSDKLGRAETIMKQFVNEQAVTPVNSSRILPGLTIESDLGAGVTLPYKARYTNLLTVLEQIAESGGVDFGVVGKGTVESPQVGEFVFRVVVLWGTDRSVENEDGNAPTIISTALNNMGIAIHSRNRSEEKNIVYVLGAGEGINRLVAEQQFTGIQDSPWNRREAAVDARSESSLGGLAVVGTDYLDEHKAQEILSFNILQTPSCRWLTHWGLGDLITARYYDRIFRQKIVEVSVRVSKGEGNAVHEFISGELEVFVPFWLLGVEGYSELGATTILGA